MANLADASSGAELISASCHDPRYPASSALEEGPGFWLTTGCFPQTLVFQLAGTSERPVEIKRLGLRATGVAEASISVSTSASMMAWDDIGKIAFDDADGIIESSVGFAPCEARYVRVTITHGHEDFASIHSIFVEPSAKDQV